MKAIFKSIGNFDTIYIRNELLDGFSIPARVRGEGCRLVNIAIHFSMVRDGRRDFASVRSAVRIKRGSKAETLPLDLVRGISTAAN